jgi:hypothetical protein
VDEIPFLRGGKAASGTAFVTQATAGHPWGGSAPELEVLQNREDISRLVVFDTWTRNCDRHPPDLATRKPNYDNVFLADVPGAVRGAVRLIAMDHTHCFTCGGDLDHRVAKIANVQDNRLYGMFPAFVPYVRQQEIAAAIDRLRKLDRAWVTAVVDTIPADWDVSAASGKALAELIVRRAGFVADRVMELVGRVCWSGQLFDKRE